MLTLRLKKEEILCLVLPEKLSNEELPPRDSFFNILRNSKPFGKGYNDFENLVQGGLSREQALARLKMENVPPTGLENYAFLLNIWDNEHMQSFAGFLQKVKQKRCCRNIGTDADNY